MIKSILIKKKKIVVRRGTDQKFWAHQVAHTPLTEVNLFTLRHLSSFTLISRDFPVAV